MILCLSFLIYSLIMFNLITEAQLNLEIETDFFIVCFYDCILLCLFQRWIKETWKQWAVCFYRLLLHFLCFYS